MWAKLDVAFVLDEVNELCSLKKFYRYEVLFVIIWQSELVRARIKIEFIGSRFQEEALKYNYEPEEMVECRPYLNGTPSIVLPW